MRHAPDDETLTMLHRLADLALAVILDFPPFVLAGSVTSFSLGSGIVAAVVGNAFMLAEADASTLLTAGAITALGGLVTAFFGGLVSLFKIHAEYREKDAARREREADAERQARTAEADRKERMHDFADKLNAQNLKIENLKLDLREMAEQLAAKDKQIEKMKGVTLQNRAKIGDTEARVGKLEAAGSGDSGSGGGEEKSA